MIDLVLVFILLAVIVLVLVSVGDLGPQWLKNLMRRYQRWSWGDAAPFDPIDPYVSPKSLKDLGDELGNDASKFPPIKQRMNNAWQAVAYLIRHWNLFVSLLWWIFSAYK